jgi:hypothetical protein
MAGLLSAAFCTTPVAAQPVFFATHQDVRSFPVRPDSGSSGFVKKRQNPAKNCLEAADQEQLSSNLSVRLFGLSRVA